MPSITSVTADDVPGMRLTSRDLQFEFQKTKPTTPVHAWLLYFTVEGDQPTHGRAEALRILNRVGISYGDVTLWGDCFAKDENPDWLGLITDRKDPLIQSIIDRQRRPIV